MIRAASLCAVVLWAVPAFAGDLGDPSMGRANNAAAKVLNARMAAERPEDYAVLKTTAKADIIVVSGEYDRVEDVLKAVGIPHVVISPGQLARTELNAKQLVIIDCPGNIGRDGIEKVRRFVNAGGFLYTTDWALLNVVQKAFPGFIEYNQRPTSNDVVEVEVRSGTETNLLKHLQLSKENPKWWLESSSYPVRILNPEKVEVLISSREMKRKYGESPIAVMFHYGDGRVLHMASHFYLQQNQRRSVADAKSGGKYLKEEASLPKPLAEKLAADGEINGVAGGDLSSAYAAQQMTSNLVVERKKDQTRVDSLYGKSIKVDQSGAGAAAPAMRAGTRVKVLEQQADQVKVRDMSGDERWVPQSAL